MRPTVLAQQSDDNLVCREFLNRGKVKVIFRSILELSTHYRERPEERVKECLPGERVFLTHAYYVIDTVDKSSPVGTWFFGPDMKLARRRV